MRRALDQCPRTMPVDEELWRVFAANLHYCAGDLTEAAAYEKLEQKLSSFGAAALRHN